MATEKRLISLDDVLRKLKAELLKNRGVIRSLLLDVIAYLENQPVVDAVEVVRCKDCKYFRKGQPFRHECKKVGGGMFYPNSDDFCSYGERKDNG